ncbi:MAG: DUF3566 domain-containing protein [Acidimicrobiia bacterium]|nr:DUF3566 domain-containing protein [Acidimicrobiia bacterium]
MSPEQPALTTAVADEPLPAAEGNGSVATDVGREGDHRLPPLAPPAADQPVIGRRQRTAEREQKRKRPEARTAEPVKLTRQQRKAQYRLRARKVKRVIRRFDPWSILKISLIFYLCFYVVAMVAGFLLWNLGDRAGVIENVEGFVENMGAFETFDFEPDLILQGSALIGGALVVVFTGLTVLAAVLFNLISDLVGGVRITVIEEDGARPVGRERKARTGSLRGEPDDATARTAS